MPALPALPGASLLLHSSPAMRWCNGAGGRDRSALAMAMQGKGREDDALLLWFLSLGQTVGEE